MEHHDTGLEHDAETVSTFYYLGWLIKFVLLSLMFWVQLTEIYYASRTSYFHFTIHTNTLIKELLFVARNYEYKTHKYQ